MKCAKWEECAEVSIRSEIVNLKEVEANLRDLHLLTGSSVIIALSFVQQAIQQLSQIDPQADPTT